MKKTLSEERARIEAYRRALDEAERRSQVAHRWIDAAMLFSIIAFIVGYIAGGAI